MIELISKTLKENNFKVFYKIEGKDPIISKDFNCYFLLSIKKVEKYIYSKRIFFELNLVSNFTKKNIEIYKCFDEIFTKLSKLNINNLDLKYESLSIWGSFYEHKT